MQREILNQAIKCLNEMGANIMCSRGNATKTWWIEENGVWNKSHFHSPLNSPVGFYLDDEELLEFAEINSKFRKSSFHGVQEKEFVS